MELRPEFDENFQLFTIKVSVMRINLRGFCSSLLTTGHGNSKTCFIKEML